LTVAAVVLAAGASTRLGEPKQNVRLNPRPDPRPDPGPDPGPDPRTGPQTDSETLLERAVRVAREAGFTPLFAVLAPGYSPPRSLAARLVVNEDAAEGMASSIRAGIAAAIAAGASGVVILACDQPFVTAQHLCALAELPDAVAASAYAGRKGVPAYFPASAFSQLLELRGDAGARDLLREARAVALKKGELDIDTAEDLKRARELYAFDPPL